jgi:hypothetical protein
MNRWTAWLGVLAVAGCVELGGRSSSRTAGGSAPEFEPIADGGAPNGGEGRSRGDVGGCIAADLLGPECRLAGGWILTHSNPDQPCPFGASRHRVDLLTADQQLCIQRGDDFQNLELGTGAPCSIVLRGERTLTNTSESYREIWTSRLTFLGDGGAGETEIEVSGGSNCRRTFQTTVTRP